MLHFKIRIEGKVQAVWFRVSTKEEADRIGLSGFVRNEHDGSVYVEIEGERGKLEVFVKWCHIGSEQSEVIKVSVHEGEIVGFQSFNIA